MSRLLPPAYPLQVLPLVPHDLPGLHPVLPDSLESPEEPAPPPHLHRRLRGHPLSARKSVPMCRSTACCERVPGLCSCRSASVCPPGWRLSQSIPARADAAESAAGRSAAFRLRRSTFLYVYAGRSPAFHRSGQARRVQIRPSRRRVYLPRHSSCPCAGVPPFLLPRRSDRPAAVHNSLHCAYVLPARYGTLPYVCAPRLPQVCRRVRRYRRSRSDHADGRCRRYRRRVPVQMCSEAPAPSWK